MPAPQGETMRLAESNEGTLPNEVLSGFARRQSFLDKRVRLRWDSWSIEIASVPNYVKVRLT